MPATDVVWVKPSKMNGGFVADLIEVRETQRREWDNASRTYNPIWIVEVEERKWKAFSDPSLIEMFREQGKYMFPSTTLTLVFMTNEDKEMRWELSLGYKGRIKAQEEAIQTAAAGRINFIKCKNIQDKGNAIALTLGGKEWHVATPNFDMSGDPIQTIQRLLDEGWWTVDDLCKGVSGRNAPIGKTLPDGSDKPIDMLISERAAMGFIGRPYKISVKEGHHNFQGYSQYPEVTPKANTTKPRNSSPYEGSVPF